MAYTVPGETRRRVFEFVRDRLLTGDPPSIREVQERFGFRSVESARGQLDALVREGLLVKIPGVSRGYRLADRTRSAPAAGLGPGAPGAPPGALRGASRGGAPVPAPVATLAPPVLVPLLGRVQAGALAAAVNDPDGYVVLEARPRPDELFALRVRGDSMTGAGILPGDVVVVRRQPEARAGDIVVALVHGVEDEATIKTLRRRPGRRRPDRTGTGNDETDWILQPENPQYAPIVPEPGTLEILGKVIEVRRQLGT